MRKKPTRNVRLHAKRKALSTLVTRVMDIASVVVILAGMAKRMIATVQKIPLTLAGGRTASTSLRKLAPQQQQPC